LLASACSPAVSVSPCAAPLLPSSSLRFERRTACRASLLPVEIAVASAPRPGLGYDPDHKYNSARRDVPGGAIRDGGRPSCLVSQPSPYENKRAPGTGLSAPENNGKGTESSVESVPAAARSDRTSTVRMFGLGRIATDTRYTPVCCAAWLRQRARTHMRYPRALHPVCSTRM
jgi:hypothetical protein